MARINNILDLHKKREARISEDYKKLFIWYELKSPVGVKKDIIKIKSKSSFLNCKIKIDFNKDKLFIKMEQEKSDLNKLYKIFVVISYLLGNEIILFLCENFSYYHIPHYFNFGNYSSYFINNKRLILEPKRVIENGYKLFCDKNTFFSILVPSMLDINTISYSNVRFFAEFSLLEFLASKSLATNVIFNKKKDKEQLKEFSKEILNYVNDKNLKSKLRIFQNQIFINKIKNILSTVQLNQKGNTKDKIVSYIRSFNSKDIQSYNKYVKDWNKLRNKKGLAHGNIFKPKSKREEQDEFLKEELHEFLSLIIFKEFTSNYEQY